VLILSLYRNIIEKCPLNITRKPTLLIRRPTTLLLVHTSITHGLLTFVRFGAGILILVISRLSSRVKRPIGAEIAFSLFVGVMQMCHLTR